MILNRVPGTSQELEITIDLTATSSNLRTVFITNPTGTGFTWDYEIDWGDTTVETITTSGRHEHYYASQSVYTIKITGTADSMEFEDTFYTTTVTPSQGSVTIYHYGIGYVLDEVISYGPFWDFFI